MIRECIRGCRGFPGVILLTNLAHATSLRSSRVGIPALANALAYGREGIYRQTDDVLNSLHLLTPIPFLA